MERGVRVLIVDDSCDDAELYGRLLSAVPGCFYRCAHAAEAGEALALLAGDSFDCAIVDYSLPGMDGLALLKRIRETERFLPLVMLTGLARDDLAPPILALGASTYLDKARIDQAGLHGAISEAIRSCTAARLAGQRAPRPILIIDDSDDDRESYVRMLNATSYGTAGIVQAADGAAGLAHLERGDFEAILLDYGLPGMDGLGVLAEIRRQNPFVPVLFITGVGNVTVAVQALQAGASDYLVKLNFDAERIARAISECIAKGAIAAKDAEIRAKTALLAKSESNAHLILDKSRDMISRVGADGTRLYASAATRRVFGIAPEDFVAGNYAPLIHTEDLPAVQAMQRGTLDGTLGEATLAFRVQHPERGEIWVESTATAFHDEMGAPAGYISITRDVTERMRMEQERDDSALELRLTNMELERLARHMAKARTIAEQANRAKTRFLAGMSHELRTPLNGILGYAQLMRAEGELSPTQAKRVQAMLSCGTHLLEMISCVLDLSEIETEGIDLQIEPIDIAGLAEACLDVVRPAANAKGLGLRLAKGSEVPPVVMGSKTRLRQVLLNLLGNAVKYTASGAVELCIGVCGTVPEGAPTAGGKARLRLAVADTGPGIPAEKRHLLFEEFERLGAGATTLAEGAGLGLSLAKRLAVLMGGMLGYVDNPAGGSVFFLELPLVTGAEGAADDGVPQHGPTALAPPAGREMRVLVVDDNAMNRDIAAAFLRSAGYEVSCAEDGAAAVELAAAADYQIILMDVRMPLMDGLEATRRIRALGGARAAVPILALTAQTFAAQIAACTEAGMDGHIGKPFTPHSLLKAIARHATTVHAPAGASTDHAEARSAPVIGTDLPAFNLECFLQTASIIDNDVLQGYLADLGKRMDSLRAALDRDDLAPGSAGALAMQAHALGSAGGLLGFDRLAFVCKHFEDRAETAPDEAGQLVEGLRLALRESLCAYQTELEIGTGADADSASQAAAEGSAQAGFADGPDPLLRRMTNTTLRDFYVHWQRVRAATGRLPRLRDLHGFEHQLAVDGLLLTMQGNASEPKMHVAKIGTALTRRLGKNLAGATLQAADAAILVSAESAYRRCLTGQPHYDDAIISLGSFGKLRFERLLLPISDGQSRADQLVGLAIFEDCRAGTALETEDASG